MKTSYRRRCRAPCASPPTSPPFPEPTAHLYGLPLPWTPERLVAAVAAVAAAALAATVGQLLLLLCPEVRARVRRTRYLDDHERSRAFPIGPPAPTTQRPAPDT